MNHYELFSPRDGVRIGRPHIKPVAATLARLRRCDYDVVGAGQGTDDLVPFEPGQLAAFAISQYCGRVADGVVDQEAAAATMADAELWVTLPWEPRPGPRVQSAPSRRTGWETAQVHKIHVLRWGLPEFEPRIDWFLDDGGVRSAAAVERYNELVDHGYAVSFEPFVTGLDPHSDGGRLQIAAELAGRAPVEDLDPRRFPALDHADEALVGAYREKGLVQDPTIVVMAPDDAAAFVAARPALAARIKQDGLRILREHEGLADRIPWEQPSDDEWRAMSEPEQAHARDLMEMQERSPDGVATVNREAVTAQEWEALVERREARERDGQDRGLEL